MMAVVIEILSTLGGAAFIGVLGSALGVGHEAWALAFWFSVIQCAIFLVRQALTWLVHRWHEASNWNWPP